MTFTFPYYISVVISERMLDGRKDLPAVASNDTLVRGKAWTERILASAPDVHSRIHLRLGRAATVTRPDNVERIMSHDVVRTRLRVEDGSVAAWFAG